MQTYEYGVKVNLHSCIRLLARRVPRWYFFLHIFDRDYTWVLLASLSCSLHCILNPAAKLRYHAEWSQHIKKSYYRHRNAPHFINFIQLKCTESRERCRSRIDLLTVFFIQFHQAISSTMLLSHRCYQTWFFYILLLFFFSHFQFAPRYHAILFQFSFYDFSGFNMWIFRRRSIVG